MATASACPATRSTSLAASRGRRPRALRGDRGAVTVEGAIALCSLVVVFAVVLAGVLVVTDQLRCTDAAGEAARLVARGERTLADEAVRALAPDGAALEVRHHGRTITVTVAAEAVGGLLPGITVRAQAYAELEPGVAVEGADAAR